MAGRGPLPKPSRFRQRRHGRRSATGTLGDVTPRKPTIPDLPNPDGRIWHPLTLASWQRAWASPMAAQWLDTDCDALGRWALLLDAFYAKPTAILLAEIRLQEARFGLSPIDRRRLGWDEPAGPLDNQTRPRAERSPSDPRVLLMPSLEGDRG